MEKTWKAVMLPALVNKAQIMYNTDTEKKHTLLRSDVAYTRRVTDEKTVAAGYGGIL